MSTYVPFVHSLRNTISLWSGLTKKGALEHVTFLFWEYCLTKWIKKVAINEWNLLSDTFVLIFLGSLLKKDKVIDLKVEVG